MDFFLTRARARIGIEMGWLFGPRRGAKGGLPGATVAMATGYKAYSRSYGLRGARPRLGALRIGAYSITPLSRASSPLPFWASIYTTSRRPCAAESRESAESTQALPYCVAIACMRANGLYHCYYHCSAPHDLGSIP